MMMRFNVTTPDAVNIPGLTLLLPLLLPPLFWLFQHHMPGRSCADAIEHQLPLPASRGPHTVTAAHTRAHVRMLGTNDSKFD